MAWRLFGLGLRACAPRGAVPLLRRCQADETELARPAAAPLATDAAPAAAEPTVPGENPFPGE
jgi:hypothetical protein